MVRYIFLHRRDACATKSLFFQEGVWGNLAFSKKAGFPQILYFVSLHLRQAAGQGFGVGEEGLNRGVS